MTREEIKEFSGVEPNCFETDREEDWYKIGCIDGMKAADANPDKSVLWHDASEEPKFNEEIIIADHYDAVWFTDISIVNERFKNWINYVENFDVKNWAYVSDLLPKGGKK